MDITFTSSEIYKLLHPVKQHSILFSETLNKIKSITNKYLADKRIYISEITPKSYFPQEGTVNQSENYVIS